MFEGAHMFNSSLFSHEIFVVVSYLKVIVGDFTLDCNHAVRILNLQYGESKKMQKCAYLSVSDFSNELMFECFHSKLFFFLEDYMLDYSHLVFAQKPAP